MKKINFDLLFVLSAIGLFIISGSFVAYHIISLMIHHQEVPTSLIYAALAYPAFLLFYVIGLIISSNSLEASVLGYMWSSIILIYFLFSYMKELNLAHQSMPILLKLSIAMMATPPVIFITVVVMFGVVDTIMSKMKKQ